jgi:hypothetical protein
MSRTNEVSIQRGITGAEVVDGQAEVLHAHARQHVHGGAGIEHGGAFGDFENDAAGVGADLRRHARHLIGEGEIVEELRRKVHGHAHVQAHRIPGAALCQ